MTDPALAPYREALRREICSACPDRHPGGACGRPADDPCPIETNLAPLVESVLAVGGSPSIDAYVAGLRRDVCPGCRQDDAGRCELRERAGCKLDALVLQVVEVIEATHDRVGSGDVRA